ncbi:KIN14B-interacting protein At4g14310 [Rosa rugosa]|uniref:KIN14B-interacting protein At4g14310 n=1 Tax=Rosa rugosa TaxID=74645 RepID=UPI002B40D08F|nr:KIN14B-interacting protein At4g14310 [Rosa rugosa]
MSALSARRLKDRGGVAAPTKPERRSSSVGKENPPGPTFRTSAQKPTMRPVPRVDKAAANTTGDARARWSMPSVAKGRSSSPSGFFRVAASGNVGPKNRRVSADRVERGPSPGSGLGERERSGSAGRSLSRGRGSGVRDLEVKVGQLGVRVFRDLKDDGKIGVKKNGTCGELEVKSVEIEKNLSGIRSRVLGSCDGVANLKNPDGVDGRVLERCNSGKSRSSDIGNRAGLGLKESSEKCVSNGKVLEGLKEKGLKEEGSNGGRVGIKHPSKLHEKLAFLEGKVKRIASDIKKTKEILDMNNPDASKVILSDIQEKITGIEKAMVHVSNGSGGKVLKGNEQDHQDAKVVENGHIEQVCNVKSSVKGLNREDLEARLFPHHKLIRNRTALKASSESSQCQVVETSCESKVDEKTVCLMDENPIAIEFLASLDNEQTQVTTRDGHEDLENCEVQAVDGATTAGVEKSSKMVTGKQDDELILTTDETLDEYGDQENRQVIIDEETEDTSIYQLNGIGQKTSTGGWFMSEGESVLLAHDDGSCTFYDIVNSEEKALYKPPAGVSPNMWRDCWIIRAPSADGCSGRYVVAASAGNTMDSGFCSWDFYAKDVCAFHIDDGLALSRTVLGPLPDNISYRRNTLSNLLDPETQQWWYRPCGPLIVSSATCQRVVRIYDIRDGEQVMKWDVPKPVLTMDNSSPLQWRNRGKVVVADIETISIWDVNSLNPQPLLSVSSAGRKISALHVNNTDSELGGGVRQRVSSAEAEGNDGVFCTQDSINILDFRNPSGIGLKIPKLGVTAQSVFSRGDSIFLGCPNGRSGWKKQSSSQVQQFSIRKQRLISTYALPESNAHSHHTAITQVWGNSNLVMGVCGLGLFVFDALKDDGVPSFTNDSGSNQKDCEVIGPDDLYAPSFDYMDSRALIISRDRPALWRHLS